MHDTALIGSASLENQALGFSHDEPNPFRVKPIMAVPTKWLATMVLKGLAKVDLHPHGGRPSWLSSIGVGPWQFFFLGEIE